MKQCNKCSILLENSPSCMCKSCARAYYKTWRAKNKNKVQVHRRTRNSSLEGKKYNREYRKNKYKSDPAFKFSASIRSRISTLCSGIRPERSTVQILGISFKEAKQFLESKFQLGMSWDNYGDWHIDHKVPLSSAKSSEELEKLCHISNLQPLWALDNIRKSNKIDYPSPSIEQES